MFLLIKKYINNTNNTERMNPKNLIIPILLILMTISVTAFDIEYNFEYPTYYRNDITTNTNVMQGNDNGTILLIGIYNSSATQIYKISLNNLSMNGLQSNFNSQRCNGSSYDTGNTLNLRLPNNFTICYSGLGTAYFYNQAGTQSATPSLSETGVYGVTYYNGTYYFYQMTGTNYAFSKDTLPSLTDAHGNLDCSGQIKTSLYNNFGINTTKWTPNIIGYVNGTLIQEDFTRFYWEFDNRWFYFDEDGSTTCQGIADSIQEAEILLPEITTDTRHIIINGSLYSSDKDSNTLNQYTSSNIDTEIGLICNNGLCYNQTGVCFPNNEIYPGVNSSNYICGNVSILGNDLYCYTGTGLIDDALTYCAGGCLNTQYTNIYGVSYTSGICYQNATGCSNDCTIEGYTYSDTSLSYKTCGFYDSDVCLDWSNSIPCSDGEYSLNGFCYTLNTSLYDYYSLTSFTPTPNINIATSYDEYSTPKKANYVFEESYGLIGIDYSANPTSFYISKNCDYEKTNLLNDVSNHFINTSYDVTVSGYNNGDVFTRFIIQDNGSLKINGLDNADNVVYDYEIIINETYGVCVYLNGSLVGCEAVPYIDISNIEFTVKTTTPYSAQLHSTYLKINKKNGGFQDIFTGFTTPTEPNTGLKKIKYESLNSSISYINIYNEDGLTEAFKNTTWTIVNNGEIQYQHTCTYTSTGCRVLRSYYKDNLDEGLWNYKDWEICINGLSGEVIKTSAGGNGLFNRQSPTMKIILSFVISLIVMGFFVIMGVSRREQESRIFTWMGLFLSIGSLIVFAIIGWLPVWILIVCAIIATLGLSVFFIRQSQGGV